MFLEKVEKKKLRLPKRNGNIKIGQKRSTTKWFDVAKENIEISNKILFLEVHAYKKEEEERNYRQPRK